MGLADLRERGPDLVAAGKTAFELFQRVGQGEKSQRPRRASVTMDPADEGVAQIKVLGDGAQQASQAHVQIAGEGSQTRCAQGAHQGDEPFFANHRGHAPRSSSFRRRHV